MTDIRGTLLAAPITTGNTDAKFGTHYSTLGIGGYQEFQTLAERDAIPVDEIYGRINDDGRSSGRRRFNMLVFVWETNKFYQLLIPDWDQLVTGEQKYNALLNNGYWADPPFYTPSPSANILRLPAVYLSSNADQTVETFFEDPGFDFNGRFLDTMFLLDTTGLVSGIDPSQDHNLTSNVVIKIFDSKAGGYIGEGTIKKRVDGFLNDLEPGELKSNQLYFLIPPMNREMNGNIFINPFEISKCEWFSSSVPVSPTSNILRIPANQLYGNPEGDNELFFAFGDFDFNGRFIDNIYLMDTTGLVTNLDGNATSNITGKVSIRIIDSVLGGFQIGYGVIMKRVNNTLVDLAPGDIKRDGLYLLIPPADRSVTGVNFNFPFELVKWDWDQPAGDKNYMTNLPIGDTGNTQYVRGFVHNLQKVPSVTILDAANLVINDTVSISIDPGNFDVTMVFTEYPLGKKVILN